MKLIALPDLLSDNDLHALWMVLVACTTLARVSHTDLQSYASRNKEHRCLTLLLKRDW